jgi:SH3-like domain-containing protein
MGWRFIAAFVLCLAALLAAARGGAQTAGGAAQVTAAETRCDIWAYVGDPDPAGLNVRSGPGKQFAVVGNLPKLEYNVSVHVTGATGQWFRVEGAESQDTGEVVFKGAGWVYGPMLVTQSKNYAGLDPEEPRVKIFKTPSLKAAVVLRLPNETEVTLIGCKGTWARVRHQKGEGWLDRDSQCYSTITTCS